MAEPPPRTSLVFWRAWALVGLLASAISAARLATPPHGAPIVNATSISDKKPATPRVEVQMAPAVPVVDRLLARLAVAETSAEECQLLQRLKPSEDAAVTYAITDVLERTRSRSVRACGSAALAVQPTPPAQSWLVDLAQDPDPDVHRVALEALALHGDETAQAVVIEAAHSDDIDIRASAVIALLEAHRTQAFSAAVELLNDVDQRETLFALVDALGKSQDPRALPVLETLVARAENETHLHAISALGELGQKKAELMLGSLLDVSSDEEYRAAAAALAKLTPESALGKLQVSLRSASGGRRQLALTVIMGLKLPGATELVSDILRSRDPLLAPIALQRLASKPDASLEPEITEVLSHGDRYLQRFAVRALARLGTASAIATLQKSSDSEELGDWVRNELEATPGTADEVRTRHIQNLGRGTPRPLVALARDPSEPAQAAVFGYFSSSDPSPSEWQIVAESATASTVQRLLDHASSAAPAQKLALINGLAARGDPQFAGVLRAAAHDEDQTVRRSALRGLVTLGDQDSNAELASLARSSDAAERSFGAELLSTRPDAEATSLLETLATDSNADVVNSALGGLQMRAPELAATLAQRAYQTADTEDRPSLLASLSGLAGTLAMPIYDLALKDPDDDTVLGALRALEQMQGPESARRLLAVASDTNRSTEVRSSAAASLLALGGPLVRENRALLDALGGPSETAEYVCNARFR